MADLFTLSQLKHPMLVNLGKPLVAHLGGDGRLCVCVPFFCYDMCCCFFIAKRKTTDTMHNYNYNKFEYFSKINQPDSLKLWTILGLQDYRYSRGEL